jgi:hypothetical protein
MKSLLLPSLMVAVAATALVTLVVFLALAYPLLLVAVAATVVWPVIEAANQGIYRRYGRMDPGARRVPTGAQWAGRAR